MKLPFQIQPSWRWASPDGNREFDRLLDRSLTFREKLEWLEEAETLSLRFHANRKKSTGPKPRRKTARR
ncbi:MAG TPA: hypothetical protein VFV81_09855 [Verrucomicrobiae bacterium]|nr:hypothetical protein [Verrucomicrobiae bacterium]